MADFTSTDLLDPTPPVPGESERAAVAARAGRLVRRRRYLQGAGALGAVVVMAVGVGVLATGGSSSSPGAQRIQAADSGAVAAPIVTAPTAPPATTPVPGTPAASVGQDGSVATAVPVPGTPAASVAPTAVTVSGHVSNVPAGATLTLTLSGSGGTFTAVADAAGNFSVGNIPTGDYTGTWEWVSADGTASAAGRVPGLSLTADQDVSFSV